MFWKKIQFLQKKLHLPEHQVNNTESKAVNADTNFN